MPVSVGGVIYWSRTYMISKTKQQACSTYGPSGESLDKAPHEKRVEGFSELPACNRQFVDHWAFK